MEHRNFQPQHVPRGTVELEAILLEWRTVFRRGLLLVTSKIVLAVALMFLTEHLL